MKGVDVEKQELKGASDCKKWSRFATPITQADLLKKIDGADQELLGKAQDGRFLHGMTGQLAKLLHHYSTMQLQVKNTHSYTCMHLQVTAASPRM